VSSTPSTRLGPGATSILDDHYGGPRPATPVRAIRPRTAAEQQFCALGPAAEAFIAGAAAAGHTRLGPEPADLNALTAAHGEAAVTAALERAVAFGRWKASDVRSILQAGLGVASLALGRGRLVVDLRRAPAIIDRVRADGGVLVSAATVPALDADLTAGLRRLARRDASARARAARHGQDPTLDTRRGAPRPGRGRNHRPRRL
jgi:hypothetical protein